MTRASLSRSSASSQSEIALAVGPLDVVVQGTPGPLGELIEQTLALYDVRWPTDGLKRVLIEHQFGRAAGPPAAGRFLEAARMRVDTTPTGLRATTDSGAEMTGRLEPHQERWRMTVPAEMVETERWFEVEDLLTLIVTTGWRRAGWVPLHAAGLVPPDRAGTVNAAGGVLVCAGGGGGKTSFTVAMVRRGWRSLGDDKLLLRANTDRIGGDGKVVSIKQMLNIDPAVARWFPELDGIAELPEYSASTPKRRVSLGSFWKHAPIAEMRPTHLVVVSRRLGTGGLEITPLSSAETISALLHQTVVPNDHTVARPITTAVAQLAQGLRGYRFDVHEDAYSSATALDQAERLLS